MKTLLQWEIVMLRSVKLTCKSLVNHVSETLQLLIITNKAAMFHNAKAYQTGLSEFHNLVVSIMKLGHKKRSPHMIECRQCNTFSNEHFKNSLNETLAN